MGGKLEVYSNKFTGSASYFISYTDYPLAIDGADFARAALEHARKGGVKQVNGWLVKESAISIQGHPGTLLVVDSPNGGPHGSTIKNKVYLVGRRTKNGNERTKETSPSCTSDRCAKFLLEAFTKLSLSEDR